MFVFQDVRSTFSKVWWYVLQHILGRDSLTRQGSSFRQWTSILFWTFHPEQVSQYIWTSTIWTRHNFSTKEFNLRPTWCSTTTPTIPTHPRKMSSVCVCASAFSSHQYATPRLRVPRYHSQLFQQRAGTSVFFKTTTRAASALENQGRPWLEVLAVPFTLLSYEFGCFFPNLAHLLLPSCSRSRKITCRKWKGKLQNFAVNSLSAMGITTNIHHNSKINQHRVTIHTCRPLGPLDHVGTPSLRTTVIAQSPLTEM